MQGKIIKSRFARFFGTSCQASSGKSADSSHENIPRKMSSIYEIMMSDNLESPASQWLDEAEKIVTVTFKELNDNVKSMAAFLSNKLGGSQRGSFVGLSMENSHLWQVCFWGLLMAGYKPVLIDINHKQEMTDYILESSGARTILGKEN